MNNYLLADNKATELYKEIKDTPIYDYHCHLSPKEIYEDRQFDNIGEIWLSSDHYKWRLMRISGVDEEYITGKASYKDKFIAYCRTISLCCGSPLYQWSHMELSMFLGIDIIINEANALEIWDKANLAIAERKLSPRKLIAMSNVRYIATTDDISSDLMYHKLLREDKSFDVTVVPSYRVDNVLLIKRDGYAEYIRELSKVSGKDITGIDSLKKVMEERLKYFASLGCRFSDVGIQYFPDRIACEEETDATFKKALNGESITDAEYMGFLGYMYMYLGGLYKEQGIVMQWHLAVRRGCNSALTAMLGNDCGVDCIGSSIPGDDILRILDKLNSENRLPKTVVYTLNRSMLCELCCIAGCFRNVYIGAAWWFEDHKEGILNVLKTIAAMSHLDKFMGMLTDSRSFLSYARHDFFRRILCSYVSELVQNGEFCGDTVALLEDICYRNTMSMV